MDGLTVVNVRINPAASDALILDKLFGSITGINAKIRFSSRAAE